MGVFVALAAGLLFGGIVAGVLALARRRGWEPRMGPEMARLPRPVRRVVARAVQQGKRVADRSLAGAAVEHARHVRENLTLFVSREFALLTYVLGGLMLVFGVVDMVGDPADGALPVLCGAWLALNTVYLRRVEGRARQAETLNRELSGR